MPRILACCGCEGGSPMRANGRVWAAALAIFALALMTFVGCLPITPAPTATATLTPTATATATATPALKMNAQPELLMICQGDGKHGVGGNNGYYISGESISWRKMEPAPGVYDFQAADAAGYRGQSPVSAVATTTALDARNQTQGKEPFYVWLQMAWWTPGNDWLPAHVQVERLPYVGNPADGTFPNPFDPRLIPQMEPIVAEMARRWDGEPRVSAVMVWLGEYGELNAKYICAADAPSHKADCGSEPDNVLIQAAVRRVQVETGEAVSPEEMIAAYNGWQHRWQYELFRYFVRPMIEMYARHWARTPIVVQLGNMGEWHFGNAHCGANEPGGNCLSLTEQVAAYAAHTWGRRVWLKQNGLGNSTTAAYAALMGQYATLTRVTWETGATLPDMAELRAALQAGSAICYQSWMIESAFPIPLPTQKATLKRNYETTYWQE